MSIRTYIDIVEGKASRYATPVPQKIATLAPTKIGKYLFHGTPLRFALDILRSNQISTGINWREEGDRVALSRNFLVARDFGTYGEIEDTPVVLVLDWAKLASNYQIHPYNDTQPDSDELRSNKFSIDGTEEEEAVYGEIRPLSKYLMSINTDEGMLDRAMTDPDIMGYYVDEYGDKPHLVRRAIIALKANPALNRLKF